MPNLCVFHTSYALSLFGELSRFLWENVPNDSKTHDYGRGSKPL